MFQTVALANKVSSFFSYSLNFEDAVAVSIGVVSMQKRSVSHEEIAPVSSNSHGCM